MPTVPIPPRPPALSTPIASEMTEEDKVNDQLASQYNTQKHTYIAEGWTQQNVVTFLRGYGMSKRSSITVLQVERFLAMLEILPVLGPKTGYTTLERHFGGKGVTSGVPHFGKYKKAYMDAELNILGWLKLRNAVSFGAVTQYADGDYTKFREFLQCCIQHLNS